MQLDPLQVLGIGAGLVLLGGGLWVLRRRVDPATGGAGQIPSNASRAAIGLSLMVAGYHLAAYLSPEDWFKLKVPLERAWLMVVVLVLAVGASLYMDWSELTPRDGRGEGPGEP